MHDDSKEMIYNIGKIVLIQGEEPYDIYMKNFEDKRYPHFHITDNKGFDISIGICKSEYIDEGIVKLDDEECKILDEWLASPKSSDKNITNWEWIREMWMINSDNPAWDEYDNKEYDYDKFPDEKPDYTVIR